MKLSKINWELCGAITAMFVCLYMLFTIPQPRQVVYNCSIAEISPDIPTKVREECRKLIANTQWNPIRAEQPTTEK
jgi:hypothetical protein